MKKVTLILPDKVLRTLGTSRWSRTDEMDLSPESLELVLCENTDYHESYKFQAEDIKILSIEPLDD
ncbi:MAG: hypothetical protein ACERK6_05330 [Candidatus Aminicenantaceae bacterium]